MIGRTILKSIRNVSGVLLLAGFATGRALAGDVLYITGWSGMTAEDLAVKVLVEELGHTVDPVSYESVDISQAYGKALIIVSQSAEYWEAPTAFKESTIPILSWNISAWSSLGMLASGGGYYSEGRTDLDIIDPNHPMAAGFSGNMEVCTSPCAL